MKLTRERVKNTFIKNYCCIDGQKCQWVAEGFGTCEECEVGVAIKALETEPKIGYCKDCKFFITDYMANVDEMPLIVTHEICTAWGNGCKTKEDGYCFMFKSKESEE